jgi:hypothetical protein
MLWICWCYESNMIYINILGIFELLQIDFPTLMQYTTTISIPLHCHKTIVVTLKCHAPLHSTLFAKLFHVSTCIITVINTSTIYIFSMKKHSIQYFNKEIRIYICFSKDIIRVKSLCILLSLKSPNRIYYNCLNNKVHPWTFYVLFSTKFNTSTLSHPTLIQHYYHKEYFHHVISLIHKVYQQTYFH